MVNKKRSNHVQRKISSRKSQAKVDPHVEEQFLTGRLLGEHSPQLCVYMLQWKVTSPQPVYHLVLGKVAGVMATFWKAENLSSTKRS